jgi:hypothetical protein
MTLVRDILGQIKKGTHFGHFSLWQIEDLDILFGPIIEPHNIKNSETQFKLKRCEYLIYKLIRSMSKWRFKVSEKKRKSINRIKKLVK